MSNRSKTIFAILAEKNGLNLPIPVVQQDVGRKPDKSARRSDYYDFDDGLSSVTGSEAGFLNSEFVMSSEIKCQTYVNKNYLKEVQTPVKAGTSPTNGDKHNSSSSTVTRPSDSRKYGGKENNKFSNTFLKGGKRRSLGSDDASSVVPPPKRKSLDSAIDQVEKVQAEPTAPIFLSAYTKLKMKTMEENKKQFEREHSLACPVSEMVFMTKQDANREYQSDSEEKAQSDSSFSPSSSPQSSVSSSDCSPPAKKSTRLQTRKSAPPARKSLSSLFDDKVTTTDKQNNSNDLESTSLGSEKTKNSGEKLTSKEPQLQAKNSTGKKSNSQLFGGVESVSHSGPAVDVTIEKPQNSDVLANGSAGENNLEPPQNADDAVQPGSDEEVVPVSDNFNISSADKGDASNSTVAAVVPLDKAQLSSTEEMSAKKSDERNSTEKNHVKTASLGNKITVSKKKPPQLQAKRISRKKTKSQLFGVPHPGPNDDGTIDKTQNSDVLATGSAHEATLEPQENADCGVQPGPGEEAVPVSADFNISLADKDGDGSNSSSEVGEIVVDDSHDRAEPLSDSDLEVLTAKEDKPPSKNAQKAKRKQLRNSGDMYVTPKGKTVKKRTPKPIHEDCAKNCKKNISEETASSLCEQFWSLGSHDKQKQYVATLIEYKSPARRRVRDDDSGKKRTVTYQYTLEVNGERINVCKTTFLDTLCLSETFVRTATALKQNSPAGLVREDKRGHHQPKHSLSNEKHEAVMTHVNSFPSYVSHYSRSQTKSLYFPSNLSYKKMYRLYKQSGKPYVSYSAYRKLAKKTGKKFKKPPNDTCGKCDKLKLQISLKSDEEKRKAEIELELHQRKADEAYAVKRRLKKEASTNDKMLVLVYDLEQCLPTPMLRCGESYYTRQLNTFNLTVCDTKTKLTYCYMWSEADGGRSANAIASCLLRHIVQYVPDDCERLVLFSDACTSQNRNSHISCMYFVALQEHPSLKTIEHMFLVSGHTHMEPDNKHSIIERYKRKLDKVSVPEEWYDAVEAAGRQGDNADLFPEGKFKVILMKNNFYDFSALLKGPLVKRDKTNSNTKFSWLNTFVFCYTRERLGIVQVKNSHNPAAHTDDLSFLRVGGRSASLPELAPLLQKCYTGPQPISIQKKKDLIKLLPYLDEEHHAFYHALTTEIREVEDTDPDLPEED